MAVDPRKFLLNTDYEMDKIIYFAEGSINNFESKNIAHDLGFAPLVFGVLAFNSDFSDPRTIPYYDITQTNSISFDIISSASQVHIEYQDQNSTHSKAYYRIYGFEPTNSTANIVPTNGHAKKFVLNTDYNYCKLFKKGIINGDGSVAHNLGYVPQVLAWYEENDVIIPIDDSTPTDPILNRPRQVRVTPSEVTFQDFGKCHYRIYYDEA